MTNVKLLYRDRAAIEGKKVDFIFLEDADFKTVLQGNQNEFIREHRDKNIDVVLVSYPSLISVLPQGIDFPVSLLQDMYPSSSEK